MFSSWTIVQFLVCVINVPVNNRVLAENKNDVLIPLETWYNAAEKLSERNEGYARNSPIYEYGAPVFNDINENGAKSLEVTEGYSFYGDSSAHVPKIKKKKRISKSKKIRKKSLENSTVDKVDKKKKIKKAIKKKVVKRKKKMKTDTAEESSLNSTETKEFTSTKKKAKPVDIIVHIKMN